MGLLEFLGLAAFAIVAGASIVFQAAVNADLRFALNSASWAALISYVGGAIAMVVFVAVSGSSWLTGADLAKTSWLSWFGGLFGAVYVVAAILLLPRLGAATLLALFVTGQMVMSVALDHYGILGVPQHSVDLSRLAGCALLVLGVVLIRI
ncbi:MAG: DMT family transporter [Rhizobiales bacterium]|jgi:transporter family-2 protein|nr:DMT family transporter [Hyphomicrobiales bacterium]